MAEITGKFNELQFEEFDYRSPDSEISRVRIIEMMNLLDREAYHIGDIVESPLSYDEFRSEIDNTWTLFMGQNIALSDYGIKYGINNLENALGEDVLLAQVQNETELGDFLTGRNKEHNHGIATDDDPLVSDTARDPLGYTNDSGQQLDAPTDTLPDSYRWNDEGFIDTEPKASAGITPSVSQLLEEGANFRPKSTSANFFIKVNISRDWEDV